jgi:hypothetical protein
MVRERDAAVAALVEKRIEDGAMGKFMTTFMRSYKACIEARATAAEAEVERLRETLDRVRTTADRTVKECRIGAPLSAHNVAMNILLDLEEPARAALGRAEK